MLGIATSTGISSVVNRRLLFTAPAISKVAKSAFRHHLHNPHNHQINYSISVNSLFLRNKHTSTPRKAFETPLHSTPKEVSDAAKLDYLQYNSFKHPSKSNSFASTSITKNALLAQATSRISRALVHIKWPLTRNNRPFSMDDFTAFTSWVVVGNLLWIILGTTTFILASMYTINLAGQVSEYLGFGDTKDSSSGKEQKYTNPDRGFLSSLAGSIISNGLNVTIEFEKGSVLPVLQDDMLSFRNVNIISNNDSRVRANIEKLNVSFSFAKWYEGNGLIDELEIFGMKCKLHRSQQDQLLQSKSNRLSSDPSLLLRHNESDNFHHLSYEDNVKSKETADISTHNDNKTISDPIVNADYIFSHFKIRDSYIDVYSHTEDKPLRILIFNCDILELHGDRLLVDFFGANNVTGAINDSMFTIHKHQKFSSENNKMVRLIVDGIDLGELSRRHATLKFNWIVRGKAEIVADILLPQENHSMGNYWEYKNFVLMFTDAFGSLFSENNENVKDTTASEANQMSNKNEVNGQFVDKRLLKSALAAIYNTFSPGTDSEKEESLSEYVMVDLKVTLKHLQASFPEELPTTGSGIPFISLHNLRTLIGFVNNYFVADDTKPLIIKTTAIEKLSDLSNPSTFSQTKLFNVIVSEIYEDLQKMAAFEDKRIINEKSVSWSHTVAGQLLLLGLGVLA